MSDVIQDLIDSEDAKTTAEVIRNAIGLYYIAKQEQRAGHRLDVIEGDDDMVLKEIALGI